MLFGGLSWLQDKPICQEADDLGNLVPWKGETHWTKLRMIKRQQGTCGRKRPDMPLGVGNRADYYIVALKVGGGDCPCTIALLALPSSPISLSSSSSARISRCGDCPKGAISIAVTFLS
jgi:hypothetical protein